MLPHRQQLDVVSHKPMAKSLDALNASLALHAKRMAELKAKKQQIEARERTKLKQAARSADTRRKILLGSYVMAAMNVTGAETMPPELRAFRLRPNSIALDTFLTREDDRALFGYPPLVPEPNPSATSSAAPSSSSLS